MEAVKKLRISKIYLLVLVTTLLTSWFLGVLRIVHIGNLYLEHNAFFDTLYKIILFPFGFFYTIISDFYWLNYPSNHFVNSELFGFSLFLISIFLQSFIYFGLFKLLKKIK